jgi:hypothetical protein
MSGFLGHDGYEIRKKEDLYFGGDIVFEKLSNELRANYIAD